MTRSIAIQEEQARERTAAMPKGVYTRRTKTVANSGKTRITTQTTNKKGKVLSEKVKELNPYNVVDDRILSEGMEGFTAQQLQNGLDFQRQQAQIPQKFEAVQVLTLADQLVNKLEEHLRKANILREAIQILREEGN